MTISGYAAPAAVDGVTISFTAVAAVAVSLRLFTRLRIVRNGGLDDAFISAALACAVGLTICTCIEVRYGVGKHEASLSEHDAVISLKTLFVSIIVYNLGLLCVKISILLQYLRIFPQRGFRIACYTLMAVVSAYSIWSFWIAIFFCRPVAAFWDVELADGHCLDRSVVWFINAGITIVTDLVTAILPLPRLKQLNIARRQKIALMVVFALGGFTCVISVLRLEAVYALTTSADQSYNNGETALWSSLEVNVAIVCSCLPTLRALAMRFFPKVFLSHQHEYGSTSAVELSHRYEAYGSINGQSGMRHDKMGRGWTGRREPAHDAYISRANHRSIDVDMVDIGTSPKEIRVITVVNQDIEGGRNDSARSDHGSERHLV